MQTKFTQEADFRHERDFGAKIGATFEFLGAHWRPLGKCILYFALPVSLLMGIGLGLMNNSLWNMIGTGRTNPEAVRPDSVFGPAYFGGIGLAMLGGLLSFVVLLSTLYGYARLIVANQAAVPTPAQVWAEIKSRLGQMVLAFLFLGAIYVAIVLLAVLLLTWLGSWAGLLFLVLFPALLYISVPLALFFPILWFEEATILGAWQRSFYLVQKHWWATLGLLLVATMIQGFLTVVFALPQYAVLVGKVMHIPVLGSDAAGMATQCLYAAATMLTYPVPLLAALFQYFHLVERKEGVGLRALVHSLGSSPAPVAYNHAYRPDDDGEY